jgi:hypothetical protein
MFHKLDEPLLVHRVEGSGLTLPIAMMFQVQ